MTTINRFLQFNVFTIVYMAVKCKQSVIVKLFIETITDTQLRQIIIEKIINWSS